VTQFLPLFGLAVGLDFGQNVFNLIKDCAISVALMIKK